MPGNLRALIVVCFIAFVAVLMLRRSAVKFISPADFRLWIKCWFAVTVIGFVAPNFWLMLTLTGIVVIVGCRREPLKPALFMLLFAALPMVGQGIPTLGIVNRVFTINHQLMLVLVVLGPLVFLAPRRDGATGLSVEDKFFFGFFVLSLGLYLRHDTATVTSFMREGFLLMLGTVIPYLAFSRYIRSRDEMNRVMLAFVVPVFIYGGIGIFEMVKHWSLYLHMPDAWGLGLGKGSSVRAGFMRANGPVGHGSPIVFGSLFVVAAGFLLALAPDRVTGRQLWVGTGAIWSGLISTLSRGPWVGAAVVYVVYWLTSPGKASKAVAYGLPVSLVGLVLLATPFGTRIWSLLPFIGSTAAESTVDYRQLVWDVSWGVIMKYPLFGHIEPRGLPEMQILMSGGIVDVVNSYLVVGLEKGLVGLFLFVGFFVTVLLRLRRAYLRHANLGYGATDRTADVRTGRALLATMVGLLVLLVTVSPVGHIPFLYWSLAGMCVAYTRCLNRSLESLARERSASVERMSSRVPVHAAYRSPGS